jgi:hypothetical protein
VRNAYSEFDVSQGPWRGDLQGLLSEFLEQGLVVGVRG